MPNSASRSSTSRDGSSTGRQAGARAREYYEKALAKDPGHVATLRATAVLDIESALYDSAIRRLEQALQRDPDDGLSWYFLG